MSDDHYIEARFGYNALESYWEKLADYPFGFEGQDAPTVYQRQRQPWLPVEPTGKEGGE